MLTANNAGQARVHNNQAHETSQLASQEEKLAKDYVDDVRFDIKNDKVTDHTKSVELAARNAEARAEELRAKQEEQKRKAKTNTALATSGGLSTAGSVAAIGAMSIAGRKKKKILGESVGKIAKAIKKTYGSNDIAGQYVGSHSDTDSSKPMNVKGKIASKIYGQFASDHINRGKKTSYDLAKKDILSGKEVKRYDSDKEVRVVSAGEHDLKKTMSSVSKALKNRQEAEKQGLTPKEFRTKKYEETVGANRDANEAIRRIRFLRSKKV